MKKYAAAFAALWTAAALYAWLRNFGSAYLFGLWSSALLAVFFCAAYGFGRRVLQTRADELGAPGCRFAAYVSLGMAAITYAIILLGAARVLYPFAAVLALGGFLWFGRKHLTREFEWRSLRQNPVLAIPVCAALGAAFFIAWMPPHQYDSLVYHLALPELYAVKHALVCAPDNFYSFFPQNGEMLFTLGLLLKSDILGQLIVWLACAVSCVWVYCYAEETSGSGLLAAFLTVTHTSVFLLASTTYVETLVMLWTTAGVISFLKWTAADRGAGTVWLLLCAVFCGTGFGTKYYAGMTVGILFLLGLYHAYTLGTFSARKTRLLELAGFAAVCAALYLPWAVKNMAATGNPVFPFFYKIFNQGGSGPNIEAAKGYFFTIREYTHGAGLLTELVRFPVTALANPLAFGGGMDMLGGLGWELFFVSVPLMVFAAIRNRALRLAGLYLVLHWLVWFATGRALRFFTVAVPLASALAACGFALAAREFGKTARALLITGLIIFTAQRLALAVQVENLFETPRVLSGIESRERFLSRRLDYYPCARAAADGFNPSAKILYAGEHRTYYTGAQAVPTSIFRRNDFVGWADCGSPAAIAEQVKAAGITAIISVPREERRLSPYLTLQFTPQGRRAWNEYLSGLPAAYAGPACTLYLTGAPG
ncbi:MAG: phospholipid carrier-dependent glycosyltransferase [Elusimicrobiaceae bacterium]|nr:phospholipid carrier-dependent glycosyltransferase [Elusimicrobiaceae bacterium]